MRGTLAALAATVALLSLPARAEAEDSGRYGRLSLGPRVGAGIGLASGPRGGYMAGLRLTYETPRFFYYEIEASFLHLLPSTVAVEPTRAPSPGGRAAVEVAPGHEVEVTGLYGVPLTMEVGLRVPLGAVALRAGVGFGAMISVQTLSSFGQDQSELVASFCFRPGLGLDLAVGSGVLRFDLLYLWQDASFEATGGDHDVDGLFATVSYSFLLVE